MKKNIPFTLFYRASIPTLASLVAMVGMFGLRAQEVVISVPVYSSNAFISVQDMDLHLSGGASFSGDGTWKFSGSTPMTLVNSAGSGAAFPNVVIRSNESLTLIEGDMFVNGDFFFSFGKVFTGENRVVFGPESTASAARNFSFVEGNVAKTGGKDFIFPVGSSNVYRPIEIFDLSGEASVFEAHYSAESHPDPEGPWFDGNNWPVSTCDFWSLNRLSGNDDADVRLGWEGSSCNEVNAPEYMRVARYSEGNWSLISSAADGADETVGTTSGAGLFGDFALASIGGGINVLPIELLGFAAEPNELGSVLTRWTTASETNNDYFTVQRSADGFSWEHLGDVIGAGFSNAELTYQYTDPAPLPGRSYYRLRQTDFDGAYTHSDVQAVYTEIPKGSFSLDAVYHSGEGVKLRYTADAGGILAEVYDLLGKRVFSKAVQSDRNSVVLYPNLSAGVYILRIAQGGRSDAMRFFR